MFSACLHMKSAEVLFVTCRLRLRKTGCEKGIRNQEIDEFSQAVLDTFLVLKKADY